MTLNSFDRAWDVVKAIDMDEANELAERYAGYYGSFAEQMGEEPDDWVRRLAPIILQQTNDPTNLAPTMPFTGQEVFRAGNESDIGRFFSPQRMTADQYAGWDNKRFGGNIRPVHSYRLPEIDPSRVLRIPTSSQSYGVSPVFDLENSDALERLEAAGVSPAELYDIYMGGGGRGNFAERMQDADYDYAVWPEMTSSGLYPPKAASIAHAMGIRDDLRAKVMQLFGSEGVGGMNREGYPRRYQFPTQWAFMHTGDDESRPIHEMSYEPMELQEWWDRFGASGWQ